MYVDVTIYNFILFSDDGQIILIICLYTGMIRRSFVVNIISLPLNLLSLTQVKS